MPGEVTVWARVGLPGFHEWPGAAGTRAYLAARHRHLFIVTAWARVGHDDRDTEFHDLSDTIRAWWGPGEAREWGDASCETLARRLAAVLAGAWRRRRPGRGVRGRRMRSHLHPRGST